MPATQARAMLPATVQDCEEVLMVVHGVLGLGPAVADADDPTPQEAAQLAAFAERVHETAAVLASAQPPWSRAALQEAGRALASDPTLDDKVRYGRPITPADFERQRRGDERAERGEDGEERVITTLRGFALKVARAKLYSFAEAKGLWEAAGEPGVLSDARRPDGTLAVYADAMFTPVVAGGQTWFRLK